MLTQRKRVGLASLCYQRLSLGRLANYVIPKALAWDAEVSSGLLGQTLGETGQKPNPGIIPKGASMILSITYYNTRALGPDLHPSTQWLPLARP